MEGRTVAGPDFALAVLLSLLAGTALAQDGGSSAAKKTAPKPDAPAPSAKIAGSFKNWTLLCGKEDDGKTSMERCSLVLPLVEKESQKLVFRVIVTYGPQGRLVLRVDGPTGIALQRGLEFSPDTEKVYRMPFQTCLPMGCKALLVVSDELKKELAGAEQGAITVYALNGTPVRTVTSVTGFAEGMAALDKRRNAN